MTRILGVMAVLVALSTAACTGSDSHPVATSQRASAAGGDVSPARAREVLADLASPMGARFDGGTFDVGHPIPGPTTVVDGRLASMSWDFYYLLDDGDRGSWGAAVKIFRTPDEATKAADAFATFWGCDGPRTVIGEIDPSSYDDLMATYCLRAGGSDYLATVSAVDGRVTANLTVSAVSRHLVLAELEAAWASLDVTAREAARSNANGH
jgi:hypothetical protein